MGRVFIDPGHSGSFEPGACWHGFRECDVALNISRKLCEELLLAGHEAELYRQGDIGDDSLIKRAKACNAWGADIFVSIHCNAHSNQKASGTEVFHYPGSVEGEALAVEICNYLCELVGFKNRGAKPGILPSGGIMTVLEATNCPAVLVEVGFLSNFEEAAYMADVLGSDIIAASIAQTIDLHFKHVRKGG